MSPVIIGDAVLYLGDCLDVLPTLPKVDCIVTDPPYGLGFMGKEWDHGVPGVEIWRAAFDVLKPGGHLLAFSGSRTYHRMVCAIEDAGFEIRDQIMWVYGSGFPKSLDVSKAIDKAAGAEREVVGVSSVTGARNGPSSFDDGSKATNKFQNKTTVVNYLTDPGADAARQWQGWGTALKPSFEPVVVARKPLAKGNTVAANVLQYGTGAINVDACRVDGGARPLIEVAPMRDDYAYSGNSLAGRVDGTLQSSKAAGETTLGRWPANLIHDGSAEVLAAFPQTTAATSRSGAGWRSKYVGGDFRAEVATTVYEDGGGSAARFFYCAKASKSDRDEGLDGMEPQQTTFAGGTRLKSNGDGTPRNLLPTNKNTHPTVKPTDLMRYLCRLVTPPGGLVLDPFMGSGSTGKAARLEGFRFCGVELDPAYFEIAVARIEQAHAQGNLFAPELQEEEALL